jgi:diguanylate cyclase (GGDEF)-like protein
MSSYDTLTDLLNRRGILEKANEWLLHAKRYKGHLTAAMLDIDHFKLVNDEYGHRVGDRVLAELSNVMQRSIRQTDFIGRYGGEEFLIILPRTDAAGAAVMAERVRSSLEQVTMHDAKGTAFYVTASIGVAEYIDGDDEDALVSRADAALYRAKEAGRNRVEVAACPG